MIEPKNNEQADSQKDRKGARLVEENLGWIELDVAQWFSISALLLSSFCHGAVTSTFSLLLSALVSSLECALIHFL